MAFCSVKDCKNNKKFRKEGISFHNVPKRDNDLQKQWLDILGIDQKNWKWSKNIVVCSNHFKEEDIVKGGVKRFLKPNVVPTCNLHMAVLESKNESFCTEAEASTSRMESTASFIRESTPSTDESKKTRKQIRRKRKLEPSGNSSKNFSTSTSTDSSTKRRKVRLVKAFHSYSMSPNREKTENYNLKIKQQTYRRKLYNANRKIKLLKKKVLNMSIIMESLKNNKNISYNAAEHLELTYSSVPHLLMSRYLKNISNETVTHEAYPAVLREFAATLQFYSSKAYEEVRSQFALALPHQATIREWYKNINCEPGFISTAFNVLKNKVEEALILNRHIICSLVLDEISIKKQIESDGHQMWGYVNVGIGIKNDALQPASEALVLMVVSHTGHWKLPIAYFFIASLNAKEKANIILESVTRLTNIGVKITSITCDGPSVNFAMMKELGCDFTDVYNMKTWFTLPNSEQKIFCILDACHMLKLMRNNFCTLEQILDPEGGKINWIFIKKLYNLQEMEGLHIANKLKKAHMEWYRQKMKVHLAAQTLSNSVADAIDFLNRNIKLDEFKGSECTTAFIRKVDILFDILNSRSPRAKGFKAPLCARNETSWRPLLLNTIDYLLHCTDVGGRPLWLTPNKTPFIGFAITALSVCGIYDYFIKPGYLNYLLTYKVSQDHLEIFFCSIRSRNGWNNNPSCLQFMRTFRRLLLHTKISQGQGNCKVLEATTILQIPSTRTKCTEEAIDLSLFRKYSQEPENFLLDHDYDIISNVIDLDNVISNVVTYISGYVVKMLEKIQKCAKCVLECKSSVDAISEDSYSLISFKNKGGLYIPSYGVVKVCRRVEIAIRNLMKSTDNKIPKEHKFIDKFVIIIAQRFYDDTESLFPELIDHFLESPLNDESHSTILIKNIVRCYSKIRFFNLAKKYTEFIQGSKVRNELNKLILFNHQ